MLPNSVVVSPQVTSIFEAARRPSFGCSENDSLSDLSSVVRQRAVRCSRPRRLHVPTWPHETFFRQRSLPVACPSGDVMVPQCSESSSSISNDVCSWSTSFQYFHERDCLTLVPQHAAADVPAQMVTSSSMINHDHDSEVISAEGKKQSSVNPPLYVPCVVHGRDLERKTTDWDASTSRRDPSHDNGDGLFHSATSIPVEYPSLGETAVASGYLESQAAGKSPAPLPLPALSSNSPQQCCSTGKHRTYQQDISVDGDGPRYFLTQHRSRWDFENPSLHPVCNPPWLKRLQKKFPWYQQTVNAGGGPWLSARSWEYPYQWFTRELYYRWNSPAERSLMLVRITGAALLIFSLLLINVVIQTDLYDVSNLSGIYDWLHSVTEGANYWLRTNGTAFSIIVLISSFCMDLLFIIVWVQWAVIGDSFRLPVAYVMLYGLRALIRAFCIFPFPYGYIWRVPTFNSIEIRSLTVPYQPSDDFFFSGHVGCSVLAVLERYYYRCWWGVAFSLVVTLVQFTVMTITRGHYTIDLIFGAITAHWVHTLAQKITRPVDQWLGLPPRPVILNPSPLNPASGAPPAQDIQLTVTTQ